MTQEVSAATVAAALDQQEETDEDDDLLRPVDPTLLHFDPVLQTRTRRQTELAGVAVLSFNRCQDPVCANCQASNCIERQTDVSILEAAALPLKLCVLCEADAPQLCALRSACPGWAPDKIRRFRAAQEAHLVVRPREISSPRPQGAAPTQHPPAQSRTPLQTVIEEEEEGGWSGWHQPGQAATQPAGQSTERSGTVPRSQQGVGGDLLEIADVGREDEVPLETLPDLSNRMQYVLGSEGDVTQEEEEEMLNLSGVTQHWNQSPGDLYRDSPRTSGRQAEQPKLERIHSQMDLSQMVPDRIEENLQWPGPEGPPPPGDLRGPHADWVGVPEVPAWDGAQLLHQQQPFVHLPQGQLRLGTDQGKGKHSRRSGPMLTSTPQGRSGVHFQSQSGQLSVHPTSAKQWSGSGVQHPSSGTAGRGRGRGLLPNPLIATSNQVGSHRVAEPQSARGMGGGQAAAWQSAPERPPRETNQREETMLAQNQEKIVHVLEKISEKLFQGGNEGGGRAGGQLRLPNLVLPSPKRTMSGRVEPKEYYLWRLSLAKTIQNNHLQPEAVLALYSANPKLTSEPWVSTFQGCSSLKEALQKLDLLQPPLQSVYGQLVRQITGIPSFHKLPIQDRIYQLNLLLEYIEQYLAFFGCTQDLRRDNVIVVVAKTAESEEAQSLAINQIYTFDREKAAGTPYCRSLKSYLIRARSLAVDLASALQVVEAEGLGASELGVRSAAVVAPTRAGQPSREESQPRKGRAPRSPPTCLLCDPASNTFKSKPHMTYRCPILDQVKAGVKQLKATICGRCLGEKSAGGQHRPDCGVRRVYLDGAFVLIQFCCDEHQIHYRACPSPRCKDYKPKKTLDPDQEKKTLNGRTFATRVVSLANNSNQRKEDVDDESNIVFMAEVGSIKGKGGETMSVAVFFDTLGSRSFLEVKAGKLPSSFDWSPQPIRKNFAILTISGREEVERNLYDIRLATVEGLIPVTVVEGGLGGALLGEVLEESVARKYGIAAPSRAELENVDAVLILGCEKSALAPKVKDVPKSLKRAYPSLSLASSRVSNRTLYFGSLTKATAQKGNQA